MTTTTSKAPLDWSCDQISQYRDLYPRYELYARTLLLVLDQAVQRLAPLANVQTRPKSIASFAEKIQRKWPELNDPIHQLTDLCGGRVITFTQPEVKAVCDFIVHTFEIDWENSIDVSQRLKPTEFGYRSVHYIVQFKPEVFPSQEIKVEIPPDLYPLKAEIQVRTFLEHAWAGFGHDRVYKSTYAIPIKWQRELAGVAALLEQADQAFYRIEHGLQSYAASYGSYMTEDQMRTEIELLESVLECDPGNPNLLYRIGKLAMAQGDWKKAIDTFEKHQALTYEPILRDLGVSLCKYYKNDRNNPEYLRGQKYLEQAIQASGTDADALASLAGTYKDTNPKKALELYRQAFEVAPSDPYAVGNYLIAEIADKDSLSAVSMMKPAILAAMQRCNDQIAVGMNLPWAYYNLGEFQLLLNEPYQSLAAYLKAIQLSTDDWYLDTSLKTLNQIKDVKDGLVGFRWVTRTLSIALAGKFGQEKDRSAITRLASRNTGPLTGPVVILAGTCDASLEDQMKNYRPLLLDAFKGLAFTLISGGTTAGVAGLAGYLQKFYPRKLTTIGYIPELIPIHTQADRRYRELRQTSGHDFDALGPLQYWIDIIASGIDPTQVRLVGIGGGKISALEYRLALTMGARVAIIEGSSRSAGQLLTDEDWNKSENLVRLPAEISQLREFLMS